MLKKGMLLLKTISVFLLFALFFGGLRSAEIFNSLEDLSPEQTEALATYAKNSGYTLPDSVASQIEKTYVARVSSSMAETFSGNTVDDYSSPTNTYLPRDTVDYCSNKTITDPTSGREYYLLNCGYRVYADDGSVEISEGTIPDSNKISFSGAGIQEKRLNIGFKTEVKVPFKIIFGKQSYRNPAAQDYSITEPDFSYIDIVFYNTQSFTTEKIDLPENRVFKKAKQIKNDSENEITLRFYLKKTGGFYGWNSYYNESDELIFSFLLPTGIKADTSSPYGYSLEGVKVLIDPGHGGEDPGAANAEGSNEKGEQQFALLYAKELATQLKALGATVTYTRTTDTTVSLEDRYAIIRNANADLVISIHFNGSENSKDTGYFMGYFYPFAKTAASYISGGIKETDTLPPYGSGTDWHYFRPSRVSVCPVILTENGFLSSEEDYDKLKYKDFCEKYISGMTKGIVDYFVSIS